MIDITEEDKARIQAEFGEMVREAKESGDLPEDASLFSSAPEPDSYVPALEQPRPKRRGRIPYLRNPDGSYRLDETGKPLKDYDAPSGAPRTSSSRPINLAPAAPLSKREEKQVATRLASIMEGLTGIAAVGNEVFQMTEDEANAIAEPLSAYLIRMEPTSKVAKQILDEYDLVAVAALESIAI